MTRVYNSYCTALKEKNEFVIELQQSSISGLVLELFMVMLGLIDRLVILFEGNIKLEVRLEKILSPGDKAVVKDTSEGIAINFSRTHLEYLCAFLLRTYRDQMAEVNHLHIEGEKEAVAFDLTFLFEIYAESLSPEEASKLMDD